MGEDGRGRKGLAGDEGAANQALVLAHDAHDGREALPADGAAAARRGARPDALRAGDAQARMTALEQHRVTRTVPAYDACCALYVHRVAAVVMQNALNGLPVLVDKDRALIRECFWISSERSIVICS